MAIAANDKYTQKEINDKRENDRRKNQDDREPKEIKAEGAKVMEMIQFASIVPERENLPYYIIAMDWFKRWRSYTGQAEKKDSDDEIED